MHRILALIVAIVSLVLVGAPPASASGTQTAHDDYGYPYPDAPDCNEATGANCAVDQWNYYQGQCTSWVAYRLNEVNRIAFTNRYRGQAWGNANQWKTAAENLDLAVNGTPGRGSVAWWGPDQFSSVGHVGYVEKVNADGSIQMSEMNVNAHNGFRVVTAARGGSRWPDKFIHVADLATTVKPKFTAASPPSARAGATYKYTFKASGNPKPTFSRASGSFPPGLSLASTGVLSGTPTSPGAFSFQVKAKNSAGSVTTSTKTITVAGPDGLAFADRATASGDFNGDGIQDLAVGVPGEDIGDVSDAGGVNIAYGSASGFADSGGAALYQRTSDDVDHGLPGAVEAGDRAGAALAAGDFDGDGFDDLVVGVPGEDIGTIADAGQLAVVYGSASGITQVGAKSLYQRTSDGVSHGLSGAVETSDRVGTAVSTGDLNGDGFDDIVAGVPHEDIGTAADAGQLNVVYGSAAGITAAGAAALYQRTSDGVSHGLSGAVESGDRVGVAVAAGDLNGDGHADLVAGVPGEDIGSVADAGQLNVVFGSTAGLSAAGATALYQRTSDGVSHGLTGAVESADYLGASVALGDFNGDGNADLAAGVPGEDIGSIADGGQLNIAYGSSSGVTTVGAASLYQRTSDGVSHGLSGAVESGDRVGVSVAAGDLDGDGRAELVAGVPGEDIGSVVDAGQLNVVFGSVSGITSVGSTALYQRTSDDVSHGLSGAVEAGDYVGTSLAIGDYNGDGNGDLAAATPGEDIGAVLDAGQVNSARGSASGIAPSGAQALYQRTADDVDHGLAGAAEASDYIGGHPYSTVS